MPPGRLWPASGASIAKAQTTRGCYMLRDVCRRTGVPCRLSRRAEESVGQEKKIGTRRGIDTGKYPIHVHSRQFYPSNRRLFPPQPLLHSLARLLQPTARRPSVLLRPADWSAGGIFVRNGRCRGTIRAGSKACKRLRTSPRCSSRREQSSSLLRPPDTRSCEDACEGLRCAEEEV